MAKRFFILGTEILPGKGVELSMNVAKLHTNTPIQVPVIVQRAEKDGPVLLLMAGMHGDEINGLAIDFHTGAAQRSNIAQIRCLKTDEVSMELANVFSPPFIVHSAYISKSIREALNKRGKKILLFEGGKANSIDEKIVEEGLAGIQRVLVHLGMRTFKMVELQDRNPILITSSKWLRAPHSGVFQAIVKNGDEVEVGTVLGIVCDPYGEIERKVKSTMKGFIICVNEAPLVNKGDAVFHIGVATNA